MNQTVLAELFSTSTYYAIYKIPLILKFRFKYVVRAIWHRLRKLTTVSQIKLRLTHTSTFFYG